LTTCIPPAPDADAARDRRRGQSVVAGDHVHADAGPVGPLDRRWHLRPRRVQQRHQPGQAQVTFGVLAVGGDARSGRQHPVSKRQDSQSLARVPAHDPDHRVAVGGGDRPLALAAMDAGGPGEHLLGRALGVHGEFTVALVHGRHELEPRVEPEQSAACRLPRGQIRLGTAGCGHLEQGKLRRVAGFVPSCAAA